MTFHWPGSTAVLMQVAVQKRQITKEVVRLVGWKWIEWMGEWDRQRMAGGSGQVP